MAIDYEKLLKFPVPPIRHRFTREDAAFYALSVGFGQDPVDDRQLGFVDMNSPRFASVPSYAVALGYPGFWLGNPETTVDGNKVVHGEQGIALLRPLPAEGDVIGTTTITGLVDKGKDKGAILYSKKTLVDAKSGETLAETTSTSFLRGDGGFGGPQGPVKPPNPMPETAPDHVVDLATRPEQALYYRLNGDFNPIHADPAAAARAGFPRPILHGLCTFGVICHALLRGLLNYDSTKLLDMSLRFTSPVYPGETIRTEIWNNGAFRARSVERDLVIANNGKCVSQQNAKT